jgi:hypothetical protein
MNQYRYRLINQSPILNLLPADVRAVETQDDVFDTVHLGVGAMMPNDLSSHILGEIAQLAVIRY